MYWKWWSPIAKVLGGIIFGGSVLSLGAKPLLSVACGISHPTVAVFFPLSAATTIWFGHLISGGTLSVKNVYLRNGKYYIR